MELNIDFNDPNILTGYLNQALPQAGLEDARIIVGAQGGLAHLLFSSDERFGIRKDPLMQNLSQMRNLSSYFGAVEDYVDTARIHAEEFGFKLVKVEEDSHDNRRISLDSGPESYVYFSAIGDVSIESVERFERFIDMIKKGGETLAQKHLQVIEAGELIKFYGK